MGGAFFFDFDDAVRGSFSFEDVAVGILRSWAC